MRELLPLPNTDRLQQVKHYATRGWTWQLKQVNTINRFHKWVFHRRARNIFECFNRATHNYRLWQPVPIKYHTSEIRFLSLWNRTEKDNGRWRMHVSRLSLGWPTSVFLALAIFWLLLRYFIHHDKSSIFTPDFKTERFNCCNMLSTPTMFRCLLVTNGAPHR